MTNVADMSPISQFAFPFFHPPPPSLSLPFYGFPFLYKIPKARGEKGKGKRERRGRREKGKKGGKGGRERREGKEGGKGGRERREGLKVSGYIVHSFSPNTVHIRNATF